MSIQNEDLLRLSISFLCGSILGFEREYKNKSAGFRTLILITLGSTIFTLISQHIGSPDNDRIASAVVTGIGFIGAGVIFKEGFNVSGLTTAAVIWIAAALGMLSGIGYNSLALLLSILVITILSVFHNIEELIDNIHHRMNFNITFCDSDVRHMHNLEKTIKCIRLKSKRICISKKEQKLTITLMISGSKNHITYFSEHLMKLPEIERWEFG